MKEDSNTGRTGAEAMDEEWEPDEESRADLAAAKAGDLSRFRTHEQVWLVRLDEAR